MNIINSLMQKLDLHNLNV